MVGAMEGTGGASPSGEQKKGIIGPLIGAVLGVGFLTLILIWQFNKTPAGPTGEDLRINAVTACERAVAQNLKAPATAQYQSTASGVGPWTVTGTVDAENSFGALVRSQYECSVELRGEVMTARIDVLQ